MDERGGTGMIDMAIVKANYTKSCGSAKANIRYIQHRKGKDGATIVRTLFGSDGTMNRGEAYRIIDEAEQGSVFFRLKISPDPRAEDTKRDLFLQEVTHKTLDTLEQRIGQSVSYVASIHDDHSAIRHVHVLAVVKGRLGPDDFKAMRETATQVSVEQRKSRDQAAEQHKEKGEDKQPEL
jgi:hypothetical protein